MIDSLTHAFMDESGTAGLQGTQFMVVALIHAENPRQIEVPVRRALKKYGLELKGGELKAAHAAEKTNLRLLEVISRHVDGIIAVIVDQRGITQPPADPEAIYRQAVGSAIHLLMEHAPRVLVCIDKRYSKPELRLSLEKAIRNQIMDINPQMLLLSQESSQTRKELQAADTVAWAFFQKYERAETRFYNVIASKVLVEKVITRKKWEEG